jgi:aspartate/methionine/tyrosine aminotransferase
LGTENAFVILGKAEKLKEQGKNIINLGIGQPDFRTPDHIVEASIKALRDGKHGYTPANGILELREAVSKDILIRRKANVNPENIVIVPGGKVTMWHAILMFGGSGKEIIYPNPGFPIYESVINYTGAKAVPMKLKKETEFNINIEQLKDSINNKTSLIILNSPSNPTGGLISKKDMDAIVRILEKNPHVHILSDEIYSRIIYEGNIFTSLLSYPQIINRLIVLDGWSKTYAMTGWRIGYSVWPDKLVKMSERLNINSFSCTNASTQYAAIAALEGPQDCVESMVKTFEKRGKTVAEEFNKIKGFSCNQSKGAFYIMPSILETGLTSDQLQDFLLYKLGITTVSGKSFGNYGEGYIRISYANSEDNIKEAISRIKTFLESNKWEDVKTQ